MKKIILLGIIAVILALGGLYSTRVFGVTAPTSKIQTSVATSTPVYMTAGTATTTLYLSSDPMITSVGLGVVIGSSSTPPKLNYRFEFSNDNVDWFPMVVSTTSPDVLYPGLTYQIVTTASSTATDLTTGNAVVSYGLTGTTTYWFVRTPQISINNSAYGRVVITSPIGNKPISLWAKLFSSNAGASSK